MPSMLEVAQAHTSDVHTILCMLIERINHEKTNPPTAATLSSMIKGSTPDLVSRELIKLRRLNLIESVPGALLEMRVTQLGTEFLLANVPEWEPSSTEQKRRDWQAQMAITASRA